MKYRNIFAIVSLELLLAARSKIAFALNLIMPFIMVLLMGTVMKPTFEAVENKTDKFSVLYSNSDSGTIGKSFDTFIKQSKDYFQVIEMSRDNVEETMISGKYPVAIIVPEDLSTLISQNQSAQIEVIGSGKHPVQETIIRSFINSFIERTNTSIALSNIQHEFDNTIQEFNNNYIEEVIPEKTAKPNLTSFQFFSASMLVFFLLTSGIGIGCSLIDDKKNRTFKRIHSFSMKKSEYLIGKIIGNGLIALFQALSIILITSLAFGVDWGNNLSGIYIIVFLIIAISSAIGIIFSIVLRSSGALTSTLVVIFWFMAFINGSFTGSPLLDVASKLTINHYAFNALVILMNGGELIGIIRYIILLTMIALILWTLGLVLYNRRTSYE